MKSASRMGMTSFAGATIIDSGTASASIGGRVIRGAFSGISLRAVLKRVTRCCKIGVIFRGRRTGRLHFCCR